MPIVRVRGGTLTVDTFDPEGPIDPGFGGGISGIHPGHDLPSGIPPIGGTLPEQPPGVWPPIGWLHPIQPLPPDANVPPGTIWPPVNRPADPGYDRPDVAPGRPDAGLPPAPARPGQGLPSQPGGPSTLPLPSRVFWMLAYCPSLGWNYVAVDPSLTVGYPLPPAPAPKA